MSELESRIALLDPSRRALLLERARRHGLAIPGDPGGAPLGGLRLSLMFFSGDGATDPAAAYHRLLEIARRADELGYEALWMPERHFDPFGGLHPNPAVLAAAVATVTRRIHVRAGSVVLPLHHPIRVVEEWSVVDNISGGRAGLSFASGWHPDDFVLGTGAWAERRELLVRQLEQVRRLWAGEPYDGASRPLHVYPRPVQARVPIWLTSVRSLDTWMQAARLDVGVLTGLMEQSVAELADKIAHYRAERARCGHDPAAGRVTVMVHAHVGADDQAARRSALEPLAGYLRRHLGFYAAAARRLVPDLDVDRLTGDDREALVALGVERYLTGSAMIGSPATCRAFAERLRAAGVNEIACLIDFGVGHADVLDGIARLAAMQAPVAEGAAT